MRRYALLGVVLGALVGLLSTQEALLMADLSVLRRSAAPGPHLFGDAELVRRTSEAQVEAQLSALSAMRGSRAAILAGLSVLSMLTFGASLGILRPGGRPREPMRRLLSSVPFAAAVLRVLDGAQMAVVYRRVGQAVGEVMTSTEPYRSDPNFGQGVPEGLGWFVALVSAGLTFVVAGGFIGVTLYFRSPPAKEELLKRDALLDSGR